MFAPRLSFERTPAISRVTITGPTILEPLRTLNSAKGYQDQIKPFNFLLTCHIDRLGHPVGTNPEKFHLISAFKRDARKWLRMDWIDQYSGKRFKITTQKNYRSRTTARIQTYGDVIAEYKHHPESKCFDSRGNVCDRRTAGLLYRRHVRIGEIVCIGKESNKLEEVDAGLVHSPDSVYTVYADPTRDIWERNIRPKMRLFSLKVLMAETGLSRRMLIKAKNGQVRPHARNRAIIAEVICKFVAKGHVRGN
jgi:hypothetical protein